MLDKSDKYVINPMALLPFTTPGYQQPTGDDYYALKQITGKTGVDFATALGVSQSSFRSYFNAKNINKGLGIPYFNWRFMLEATGLEKPVFFNPTGKVELRSEIFSESDWTCPNLAELSFIQKRLGLKDITLCKKIGIDLEEFQKQKRQNLQVFDNWFSSILDSSQWIGFLRHYNVEEPQDLFDARKRINPAVLNTLVSGDFVSPEPHEVKSVLAASGINVVTASLISGLRDDEVEFYCAPHSYIRHKVSPRQEAYELDGWKPPRHDDLKILMKISGITALDIQQALNLPRWEASKLKLKGYSKALKDVDKESWFSLLSSAGVDGHADILDKMKMETDFAKSDPFYEEKQNSIPYAAWRLLIQSVRLVEPERI